MSKKIMEIERTGGKVLIPDQYKYNTKVKHCPPQTQHLQFEHYVSKADINWIL